MTVVAAKRVYSVIQLCVYSLHIQHSIQVGNAIDKKLLSTINKISIDKLSIRSFCYQQTVDKSSRFLSTNC